MKETIMIEELDPKVKQAIETVYFEADPVDKKILEYHFGLYGAKILSRINIFIKVRKLNPNIKFKEYKEMECTLIDKISDLI